MAEKILNTRIQLKYDTWDNWQKVDVANKGGNLVLKKGEMAVTAIASGKSDFTTPPTIMFKVGDGEHKFSELPWASGLAADVYPWAKSPTAPVIGDGKITIKQGTAESSFTVNQSGDTTITLDADTDTNTQYKLVIDGHALKLQSKEIGGNWAEVQSITLPDNNTTYTFASTATSGAYFKVTPSGGAQQTVYIDGLGSAALKAASDFATAAQGTLAESALQSVKTLNTNNTAAQTANASEAIAGSGTINLHKVSKTGSYNDLLNKPTIPTVGDGALTIKVGDKGDVSGTGSFTANQSSAGTITLPVYTKTEVDEKIVGAVQYLGTVGSADELAALTPNSVGDFCRVSTAFGSYHVGDLLLCKTLKTDSTAATWDVIHGEIDKDTWTANSKTAAGYVAAGGSNANKVWKTDANGNPAWRDDADTDTNTAHTHTNGVGLVRTGDGGTSGSVDYKVALASETLDTNAAVSRPAANANRTYPVIADKNGKLATIVPWTDTNTDTGVTSVEVTGTGNAVTSASISGRKMTLTKGTTFLTSHQDISGKQDKLTAGTHISIDNNTISAAWPTTSDSGYAGINKTGTVTSVTSPANSGLKVSSTTTTPVIEIDDAVVFVLNGGSSTEVI